LRGEGDISFVLAVLFRCARFYTQRRGSAFIRNPPGGLILKQRNHGQHLLERIRQKLRLDEIQVVRAGMILGKRAVLRTHETADRKIESGRAVLPFVVAVGKKVDDAMRRTVLLQDVLHGAINFGIAAPGLLVSDRAGIAEARQYESVFDVLNALTILARAR
jgi:hypothetical protein